MPEAQYAAFQFLNSFVGVHRSGTQQPWKSTPLGFCPTGHCGALALLFVRHLLWGEPLVYMQAQVEAAAESSSVDFGTELPSACHRPRLAALGLDPSGLLGDLLQKHGVGADEVSDRVALIRRELGDDTIAKVVLTGNPWQELKWHANHLHPPLTLIKPSELQKTIDQRADRPVGAKKHKQAKGKGKGKHALSAVLDPTMLRLEGGVFQSQQGQALAQVALTGLAVGVSGVVLTIQAVAKQYLQAGKTLSTGALGFLLLDDSPSAASGFPPVSVRVPLVCAAISEPLLVDACLVQMGAIMVERAPATVEFSVQSVPACVVKAMVYRDLTACNWQEVVAHPLRHIFDHVPPLQQVCPDHECPGCECWHQSAQYPIEGPVVEVWSKQWLRLNFVACPPHQAEVFVVNLRIPVVLQHIVQEFSGFAGIFLEPKSVDGRRPSELYQVIWFPKAALDQLMVQRQTIPEVCDTVRLGHKLGLRCKTEHAAAVFAKIKPGMTFLPAGKKQSWLVGPFPWVGFVSGQSRRFRIRHSTGEAIQPVCGLPEGCAMSVFGMVNIDWMLEVWLQQLSPPPALQAFIDDWSVTFAAYRNFALIWASVQDFTNCLDLKLDLRKTKLWSTAPEARRHFREGTPEVACVARILGAHQNYTRHAWNAVMQLRLQALPGVWTKLRASLAPYKAKHIAIRMMGWPQAFHACSVEHSGRGPTRSFT